MKWLLTIILLCAAAFGQAPVLFYSDLPTATCTAASPNGVNGKGAIITVTGLNFGTAQDGTHYLTLTPSGGGAAVTMDSYIVWNGDTFTTPTTGYKTIAFQPATTAGGCPSVGDYLIKVVTPSGTSNTLPLHIYSGGTIYFVDNVSGHNGSDSNNGKYSTFVSGTNGPFLNMAACRIAAVAATGNLCYAMPGSQFSAGDPDGASAVITVKGHYGTSNAYIGIMGYPTASTSNAPKLNCPDNVTPGCTPNSYSFDIGSEGGASAAYVVLSNFRTYYYGQNYGVFEAGNQDYNQTPHHIRFINVDMSGPTSVSSSYMVVPVLTTYSQFYGMNCHDLNDIDGLGSERHVGCFYLGDASDTIDVAWSVLDSNCSIAGTCKNNTGIEIHSTGKAYGKLPGPVFQAGSGSALGDVYAAGGGSLGAGTYDIFITYRSRLYYADNQSQAANWIPDAANCFNTSSCHSKETENDNANEAGSIVTVTLTGAAGSNAIAIKWPTGVDHRPVVNAGDWNGVSYLCNPTLAYKVYACKEGVSCGSGPLYQGQNTYTDPSAGLPITSTDYLITSINTGNWAYTRPTLDANGAPQGTLATGQHYTASMSGCNIRNVSIHDNYILGWPGYSLTLYGIGIDSGSYFRLYNNVLANNGTGWGWTGNDYDRTPNAINNPNNDVDMRDYASGGNMEIANNTFFVSGGPTDAYNTPGVLAAQWYSVAGFPNKSFVFTNNIVWQPLNYGSRDGWISSTAALTNLGGNFTITGTNNACYGNAGANCLGTGYNFNGLSPHAAINPLFTNNGSLVTQSTAVVNCQGGSNCHPVAYTGYNLLPQAASPVYGGGTAVSYVTRDINGMLRPNPPSIGPYELTGAAPSTNSVSASGVTLKGVTVH